MDGVTGCLGYAKLRMGLNNLRVDLILLRSSRLSLTVTGTSLLLEGLSETSIKYKLYAGIIGFVIQFSSGNLQLSDVE